ncbi:hypothetical protein K440DRAFT_643965 [Wilcoxina mikolae CBS 423.85]|nr:hypothetical protein K440DRAFT_643965 [Wilcoxina mikolae CBS 423.85]
MPRTNSSGESRSPPGDRLQTGSLAEISARIDDHNRSTILHFDPKSFCPADLYLALPVDVEIGMDFLHQYLEESVCYRHMLYKVELYDGYLHLISTRMGGAQPFHDIAMAALKLHQWRFWFEEHRIPLSLYKEAKEGLNFCGAPGVFPPCLLEVATQTYGNSQTRRNHWLQACYGWLKTMILMTYQNEDVIADHTCVLEVWKTAHRETPDKFWVFPDPPPGLSLDDVNSERQKAIDAASATQTTLIYREGPLYARLSIQRPWENTH